MRYSSHSYPDRRQLERDRVKVAVLADSQPQTNGWQLSWEELLLSAATIALAATVLWSVQ